MATDQSPDQAEYASFLTHQEAKYFNKSSRRMSASSRDLLHKSGINVSLRSIADDLDKTQPAITYPSTRRARAFEKKKKDYREPKMFSNADLYEEAYVEFFRWMVLHMRDHDGCDLHPRAMMSMAFMRQLRANPPKAPLEPEIFGCNFW